MAGQGVIVKLHQTRTNGKQTNRQNWQWVKGDCTAPSRYVPEATRWSGCSFQVAHQLLDEEECKVILAGGSKSGKNGARLVAEER